MTETIREAPARRLLTVAQWQKTHSWPPAGGLRHLIFNAEKNGFATVIKRIGRRVLIDEAAFFEWVDRQSSSNGSRTFN